MEIGNYYRLIEIALLPMLVGVNIFFMISSFKTIKGMVKSVESHSDALERNIKIMNQYASNQVEPNFLKDDLFCKQVPKEIREIRKSMHGIKANHLSIRDFVTRSDIKKIDRRVNEFQGVQFINKVIFSLIDYGNLHGQDTLLKDVSLYKFRKLRNVGDVTLSGFENLEQALSEIDV